MLFAGARFSTVTVTLTRAALADSAAQPAAVAMAAQARASGLDEIAYLGRSTAPDGRVFLVAVQGDPANPASKSAYLPEAQALDPARVPVAAPVATAAAETQDQTRPDPGRPASPGR